MTKPLLQALLGFTDSARNVVLGAGLICIVAQPLNLPYAEWRWIDAILWLCLGFFALEWGLHVWDWSKSEQFRARLLSVQHLADIIAVVPIVVGWRWGFPRPPPGCWAPSGC